MPTNNPKNEHFLMWIWPTNTK